jgi:hypothetical protein
VGSAARVVMGCWIAALVGCHTPTPAVLELDERGGTFEVRGERGATLQIDVPPGALDEPLTLLVTPAPPLGDELARFVLSPTGLLLQVPIEVKVRGVRGIDASGSLAWVDGDGFLPLASTVSGGDVEAETPALGFSAPDPDGETALIAATDASALVVAPADCDKVIASHSAAITAAKASGHPLVMLAEYTALKAALRVCAGGAAAEIAALEAQACAGMNEAVQAASAMTVTDLASWRAAAIPIYGWIGEVQLTGAECSTDAANAMIGSKVAQLLSFFDQRLGALEISEDLQPELAMLNELLGYECVCDLAALDEPCAVLNTKLYPDLLDKFRASTYAACRRTGSSRLVEGLYTGAFTKRSFSATGKLPLQGDDNPFFDHARFTYADLEADAVLCASTLQVRVLDGASPPQEISPSPPALGGGETPGSGEDEVAVNVPATGRITLDARLVAPTCAGQVLPEGSVEVRAEHEGLVVDLTTAPIVDKVYDLGTAPYEVDAADVSKRLGGTKSFDLVLRRVGAACPGLSYTDPRKLFVVHATLPPDPPAEPEATGALVYLSGASASVTVDGESVFDQVDRFGTFMPIALEDRQVLSDESGNTGASGSLLSTIDASAIFRPTEETVALGASFPILESIHVFAGFDADMNVPSPSPMFPQGYDGRMFVDWSFDVDVGDSEAVVPVNMRVRATSTASRVSSGNPPLCSVDVRSIFTSDTFFLMDTSTGALSASRTIHVPAPPFSVRTFCLVNANDALGSPLAQQVGTDLTLEFLP